MSVLQEFYLQHLKCCVENTDAYTPPPSEELVWSSIEPEQSLTELAERVCQVLVSDS